MEEPNIPEEQGVAKALAHQLGLGQWLQAHQTQWGITTTRAHTDKATATLVTLMSLNEPGVVYDAAKARTYRTCLSWHGVTPTHVLAGTSTQHLHDHP